MYQTYLRLAEGRQKLTQDQLVPVEGGLSINVPDNASKGAAQTETCSVVCLGGTFDHLHPGHKLLLTAGALLLKVPEEGSPPCKYIIGVTGDEMLKNKKYAEFVESWETRARNVILFLANLLQLSPRGWKHGAAVGISEADGNFTASFRDGLVQVECVRIQDAYGPTITLEGIDALVVSGETRSGGKAVNDKRAEKGWKPLVVFEVDVLNEEDVTDKPTKTEDFASKISSSAIRERRATAKLS